MKAICVSALVLGLLAATAAEAIVVCLNATSPPDPPTQDRPIIVLRGFKFPKKNRCAPLVGVISTSTPSRPSAVTGSACNSVDGSGVTFTILATLAPRFAADGDPGVELRYTARVVPSGKNAGTGIMTRLRGASSASYGVAVSPCRDVFPDNM